MSEATADRAAESGIAARIKSHLENAAQQNRVAEVRIGFVNTAIRLDDGRIGLAYTFPRERRRGSCPPARLRPLAGRCASELLGLLGSPRPLEATLGLATANALATPLESRILDGDVLSHIELTPEDDVAMVGHFEPMVGALRARVRSLTVFETVQEPQGDIRPAKEAPEALRRCQVAFITATSIINNTIDGLLRAAEGCREVVVLGASTPLLPEALAGTNVTLLSGVIVTDPEQTLRMVSEAGGMRLFKPFVRKVSLRT